MFNIKEAIEKDLTNMHIKSLFVIEKEDNEIKKVCLFGSYKDNKSNYFIANVISGEKWEVLDCTDFKDFDSAMHQFVQYKKSLTKQKIAFC